MRVFVLALSVAIACPVLYMMSKDEAPKEETATVEQSSTDSLSHSNVELITDPDVPETTSEAVEAVTEIVAPPSELQQVAKSAEVPVQVVSVSVQKPPVAAEAVVSELGSKTVHTATHKEASVIKMMHGAVKVELNTFAPDSDGNLLACVTTPQDAPATMKNDDGEETKVEGYLQTYSYDGKQVRETPLGFRPTAVNQTPDGTIIVAGAGKVARVSTQGEVLSVIPSPHIGDTEGLEERLADEAEKQKTAMLARYEQMVKQVTDRIAAIEEKSDEDRTSRDDLLLKSLPQQQKLYEQQLETMKGVYSRSSSASSLMARKMGITALAVTSKDVFLCCTAIEGRGYEVWRTTHELTEPKQIMTGLGGCCGQCDIQASGDNIAVAENTKFKVALIDREGERLSDFGARDRSSVDGFGSCCNPMNVRCCSNGDILTGESSVGHIKRFSQDGEYLGLIGKARIGGGCKHVALAHDEKRNRYYMMNVDQDHICVLVPNAEAPAMTEQELIAKKAVDTHGAKFLGTWAAEKATGDQPATPVTRTVSVTRIVDGKKVVEQREVQVRSSSSATPNRYLADEYTFHADGRLEMKGSAYAGSPSRWEALEHDEKSIRIALINNEVHSYDFLIAFEDEDEQATISMHYKTTSRGSRSYTRTCCDESCEEKGKAKTADGVPVTAR